MAPRVHTLANGLVLVLLEDHLAPVATFWVWYRVGSRNELPGLTGISHWTEHMLFKGTPSHPKGELSRFIERLGGRWNAFTWKDYTAYHTVLPAVHLSVAIDLEADRMVNTIFDPAEVERERTVIISEREGSENYPGYLLREEIDAVAFKAHPYRTPVIGWKDDLRRITTEDLVRHYRTYYHPNNAVAVAVGDFSADNVLAHVERTFGALPAWPAPAAPRSMEPDQEGERRVLLQRAGGATGHVYAAYHVPAATHPDLPTLLVIDGLLSGFTGVVPFDQVVSGRSARLYRALVDSGLAADASSSISPSADPTLFYLSAIARTGVPPSAIEDRLLAEVDRLATVPVPSGELEKVKKQSRAQYVYARDGVFRRAMAMGAFAVVSSTGAFDALPESIEAVTAGDVLRVASSYLHAANRTVGIYLPPSAGASSVHEPAAAYRSLRPQPRPAHHPGVFWKERPGRTRARAMPITSDVVTRVELDNGLTVLVKEQTASGLVAVQGYVKAGAMYDGPRSGLARLTASLLTRGTASWSSQEIAETLDGLGAAIGIGSGMETVGVSARALREDAAAVLAMAAEMLVRPTFPERELEIVRGEIATGLRMAQQDTRHMAERSFRALAFPAGHPHARMPDGDEAVIAGLGRDDLAAFHAQWYRPNSTLLAIVGDLPVADVVALVRRSFAPWERSGRWTLPDAPAAAAPEAVLRAEVRLPGKVQSDIIVGVPGITRADAMYYPAMMANLILGQLGMMGRLGERVREQQGMAYYAYSDLRAGLLAGPWWVRAGINPRNEERAIASILDEIHRFAADGPADDELADAREFLTGSLALRLETTAGIAQALAEIELFGLGLDYIERYPEIIRSISAEAVRKATERLPAAGYSVAVAGPPLNP
ncbi:MAG TPA: pitrilysin family protein [bacterium]|jgi:zinc protease